MRINDYFSKVILINLDRREDRLEKISTQLDNLGITCVGAPTTAGVPHSMEDKP